MPKFTVRAPDGRAVTLTGDGPPSEAELDQIFAQVGPRRPVSAEDFTDQSAQPQGSALSRFASNALDFINPVTIAKGLAATAQDQRPEDAFLGPLAGLAPFLRGTASGQYEEGKKAIDSAKAGDYGYAASHALAAATPFIGPSAAAARDQMASGDVAGGIGKAVGLAATTAFADPAAAAAKLALPRLATIGEQIAAKAGPLASKAATTAKNVAIEAKPYVVSAAIDAGLHAMGAPPIATAAKIAGKAFGKVLDAAKADRLASTEAPEIAANAGGRLVKAGAPPPINSAIADALEALRKPDLPQSVELPPPAELPPGYTPRTEAPAPVATAPSPNAGGRVVPPQTPTVEQAISDALTKASAPEPPARITTPPAPTLPPGYTPRATVPKPTAVKMAAPDAAPAAPPKRAYFLKPLDEMQAAGPVRAEPSGSITPDTLPEAWKSRVGQDLFPTTADGSLDVGAAMKEMQSRGLSLGEAITLVSKNKALPTSVRAQLLRALSKSKAN